MSLKQWGWTPELAHETPEGLTLGRVARQDRTGHLVVHDAGEAFARTTSRLRADPPAVGDWVAFDPADPPTIRAVLPRRTAFVRAAAGRETRAQVVAANVDVLIIVAGLDGDLNLRRLERYLILAAESGARAVVVLNKADLVAPRALDAARDLVSACGAADVVAASATTGLGLDALRALVPSGVTASFVGSSGVGKSSLVNALLGEDALETGGVRKKDGRGRHTTTARHLLPLPGGGILLDTPGMRELALFDAAQGVSTVFEDVETLARGCRFTDCAHDREPGCAVRDAVDPARLASWRKLRAESERAAARADARASREQARAWGKMAREVVRYKKDRLG